MNAFVEAYLDRIRAVSNESDLRALCSWLYARQAEIAATASSINAALHLNGDFALQPDLPCLFVGSTTGLVFVSANPGWDQKHNALEDGYCRSSPESYEDLLFNYFEAYPRVVGQRGSWWSNAIALAPILQTGSEHFLPRPGVKSWHAAHSSRLIGGWELFPWHSKSDGLSALVSKEAWLHEFCRESALAALRLKPQVLLIAAKTAFHLVRNDLLADLPWHDFVLGSKIRVPMAYARVSPQTEVLAIARQIFSAPRDFTNRELFIHVRGLRERDGAGAA